MKDDDIGKLLIGTMAIATMFGGPYADDFCYFNDKLLGYSVSLVGEIDELLEAGYTKEEIITFIRESDFTLNDPELTKEDEEYLKNRSFEILDIRYELYIERKNQEDCRPSKTLGRKKL